MYPYETQKERDLEEQVQNIYIFGINFIIGLH